MMETTAEKLPSSGVSEVIAREDDSTIADWFAKIAGEAEVKVYVYRKSPRTFNGQSCAGLLDTHEEFIDEERVRDLYGGGTYTLRVMKVNKAGIISYGGQRSISIAGEPKLQRSQRTDGNGDSKSSGPAEDPSFARAAMAMTERLTAEAQRRADRMEDEWRNRAAQPAFPPEVMAMIAKAGDAKEHMLEKLLDGDSNRVQQIRTAHETELRTVREQGREDVKRAEDRLQRFIDDQNRSHEREIAALRSGFDQHLKLMEISYTTQIRALEAQYNNVMGHLVEQKAELAELRAKKEAPLSQQLQQMLELKNMMGELSGGGGDEEEGGGMMKVIGSVAEAATGLLNRAQPAQQVQQVPQAQQQALPQRPRPKRPQAAPLPEKPPIPFTTEELAATIQYIEQAIVNNVDPQTFALSVRTAFPQIVSILRTHGIESFLQAAQLRDDSPLHTQNGRNFIRTTAKLLTQP